MTQSVTEGDWRSQATDRMEMVDQADAQYLDQSGSLGIVILKLILLIVLSALLVYFIGYAWLFAVALVGWYLFAN